MKVEEIKSSFLNYKREGKRMFTTSSFQSHSLVLLHILSQLDKSIPVYFINTGYLFPETVAFKDTVIAAFGLTNVIDLRPNTPKFMQRDAGGKLLFASDPDYCCYLNKTQPMEAILRSNDIWINGVRADQSAARANMKVEQAAAHGCMRFHPMLDWNAKMIYDYRKEHSLPQHPLEAKGYLSLGCEPCTRKPNPEMMEREARWFGLNKTECGLHVDLINQ